jgi:hypothetical protein
VAEKLARIERESRRHPQAESIVAAILAEPDLWDGLQHRVREDAVELDAWGREQRGMTGRVYELENIATLFAVLNLVVANAGREVAIGQHGSLGGGLPNISVGSLTQLRMNGWITNRREGTGYVVGLGERSRKVAARWSIELPVHRIRHGR